MPRSCNLWGGQTTDQLRGCRQARRAAPVGFPLALAGTGSALESERAPLYGNARSSGSAVRTIPDYIVTDDRLPPRPVRSRSTTGQDMPRGSCCTAGPVAAHPRPAETNASGLVCGPPQPDLSARRRRPSATARRRCRIRRTPRRFPRSAARRPARRAARLERARRLRAMRRRDEPPVLALERGSSKAAGRPLSGS